MSPPLPFDELSESDNIHILPLAPITALSPRKMSISLPGLEVGIAMCLDELAHFLCVYERSPTAEPNESGCVTLSVTYRAPRGSHIAFNARMRPEDDAPWPYVLRLQHCNGGSGAEGGQAASMMSRHWPSEFDEREQEWWATNAAMRSASGAQEFVAAETTTTLSMMHASDDGGEKLVWKKTPSFVVKFIHEHADQAQCTPDAPVKIQPAAQAIHVPTPRKRCKEDESGDTEADLKRIKPDPHASHENGFASSPSAAAPRQPQAASAITIADDDEERDSSPERPLQELHQVKTEYLERLIQRRKDERDDDRKAREGILEILKNERAKTLKNLTQAETQL